MWVLLPNAQEGTVKIPRSFDLLFFEMVNLTQAQGRETVN